MSFDKLSQKALIKVAEDFGVDVKPGTTKPAIIAELVEMGVTYDMWQKFNNVEPEPEGDSTEAKALFTEKEARVLVKMERENGTYETRGYRFTRDHPFVPVKESDAELICRSAEGFRIALPSEAAQYYG